MSPSRGPSRSAPVPDRKVSGIGLAARTGDIVPLAASDRVGAGGEERSQFDINLNYAFETRPGKLRQVDFDRCNLGDLVDDHPFV